MATGQMGQPIIELWQGVGFGAIISYPSGVQYSNQTGGTSCLHPGIEGVYVPLANDCSLPGRESLGPENELYAYFDGPKHRGTGATRGLDDEDAAFIEMLLAKFRLSRLIQIDRDRLHESHEAWVWSFVVGEEDLCAFSGFGPYPRRAVLTWSNTD